MPTNIHNRQFLEKDWEVKSKQMLKKSSESKHLKGQLDPPVSDGNVFCIKAGQLDPPVSDGNVFCIKAGQLDPPVSI